MATLENPANGYRERVTPLSCLGAFLFGALWYAFHGIWGHAVIQGAIIVLSIGAVGPLAVVPLVPMWLLYTLMAPFLLKRQYLRRGWREV